MAMDANQLLEGLHDSLQAGNDNFLLKVLGQLVTSFPWQSHRLPVDFYHFGKRLRNWP